ncbi:MAG: HPr family phosphocarrier protein [Thermodesulfobacteriota bacterium]
MQLIKTLRVNNEFGLHARCAAKIVALAARYRSRVSFRKGEHEVDGSSILSLLTLACQKGTEVQVRIEGEDAEPLMEALTGLFSQRFGE